MTRQIGPAVPDDAEKAAALRRMKRVAVLLMAAMAALLVASRLALDSHPWAAWPAAFAEAALVGGLADWFAVTALFRRPLGLPIPHTAIIPRNQARIGTTLGRFVAGNFLKPDEITTKLRQIDIPGMVAQWLAQPENRAKATDRIAAAVPSLIEALDDDDVGRFLQTNLSGRLREAGIAPILGRLLDLLTAEGHHQRLLDELLERAHQLLHDNRPLVEAWVAEQMPRWLPKAADRFAYQKVLAALDNALDEIRRPGGPWRHQFDSATERFIAELKTDPAMRAKGDALLGRMTANPVLRRYFRETAATLKQRLVADAAAPDSALRGQIDRALKVYGETLERDEGIARTLGQWIEQAVLATVVARREQIGDWIASVVQKWDSRTVVDKLETQVGRDLQFIRVNGTVVGGLIGVLLHAAEVALTR